MTEPIADIIGINGPTRIAGNTAAQRIAALREMMREGGISACIVPTADPHMSEYIADHFKAREYITGFTGSAGTAVITLHEAGLWTDSRYWLQAAEELEGSGVCLFKDGAGGTPSIESWLCRQLPPESVVSVPGDAVSAERAGKLRDFFRPHHIYLNTEADPVNELRESRSERPALRPQPVSDHPVEYTGLSRREKFGLVRSDMLRIATDSGLLCGEMHPALLVTSLDDIAWLLNLRGADIPCNPVFYAFVILTSSQVCLYAFLSGFSEVLKQKLAKDGVTLFSYETFYDDVAGLEETVVIADPVLCTDRVLQSLPDSAVMVEASSPVMRRKCIKNPVEMDGIRAAHLQDGIAMCRFLCWLKQQMAQMAESNGELSCGDSERTGVDAQQIYGDGERIVGVTEQTCGDDKRVVGTAERACGGSDQLLTELSAAEVLHAFRSERESFRGDSFDPIMAYGPHGAIVHYAATSESNVPLQPSGLLLIDSGGQYLNGTTDITRTVVLGPLSDEEKRCFTAVLRGHINLARAVFPAGCTGANLDILARQPLWEQGLDYGHGTGHGVGAYLNVHEDPLRIHWAGGRKPADALGDRPKSGTDEDRSADGPGTKPARQYTQDQPAFAEGMLVSNEPGYYAAGAFGIRHENLELCVPADSSPGGFLRFETVTLVPFDLDGIDPSQMQPVEIDWLNAYHRRVYEEIAPHLEENEHIWLANATRPISSTHK